jgi:hypothetical protein
VNETQTRKEKKMRKNQANWIVDSKGKISLVLPNLYGNPRILSTMEIVGRFSLVQIESMRTSLPTVKL